MNYRKNNWWYMKQRIKSRVWEFVLICGFVVLVYGCLLELTK